MYVVQKDVQDSKGRGNTLRSKDGAGVTYAMGLVMDTRVAPKGCVGYAVSRDISYGVVQSREGQEESDRKDGGETITMIQFW